VFTGIIESLGKVSRVNPEADNIHFTIESEISGKLKIDQSIAHNGVCLTVVEIGPHFHVVTAVRETLEKSNLGSLTPGSIVNLERCMQMGDRLDGHIVQGHVDTTGRVVEVSESGGSWKFVFSFPEHFKGMIVPKGSICVNGVSLTVVDAGDAVFSVAIIPYTYEHTTFSSMKKDDMINLEFDIIGKYVARILEARAL
jgi:riboflavin synthase